MVKLRWGATACLVLLLGLVVDGQEEKRKKVQKESEIAVVPKAAVDVGRVIVLNAQTKCEGVQWATGDTGIEVIPVKGTKSAVIVGLKKGTYTVAVCGVCPPEVSDPVYCTVTVSGDVIPPSEKGTRDPVGAIVRIGFGSAGCTATVIGPRRPDGKWDVLTAAHCTGNVGTVGTMYLPGGRQRPLTVTARNTRSDLSWMTVDVGELALPYTTLAREAPVKGTKVFHKGFGVDKPGNREDGVVNSAVNGAGQIQFLLSVSSGDSGGGIINAETGELVGVVCCTSAMARYGAMWGGASVTAMTLKPSITTVGGWEPTPIHTMTPEEYERRMGRD